MSKNSWLRPRLWQLGWGAGPKFKPLDIREPTARLSSALGIEATSRLRRATVVVIGAGGTGSAVIEILARAGIGKLMLNTVGFLTTMAGSMAAAYAIG